MPAPRPRKPGESVESTGLGKDSVKSKEFRGWKDYQPREKLRGDAYQYYGSLYDEINTAMRAGEKLKGQNRTVVDDFVASLKETTEEVPLWRGRERRMNHRVGDEFTDKALQSWSGSWGVAESFAGGESGELGTMYFLRLRKGEKAVVENPMEREVTLGPKRRFRVAQIIDVGIEDAHPYAGTRKVHVLELLRDEDGVE